MIGNLKFCLLIVIFLLPTIAAGQNVCVSQDDVTRIKSTIKMAAAPAPDKSLTGKLIEMKNSREVLVGRIAADPERNEDLVPKVDRLGLENFAYVCSVLRQRGWISRGLVGLDGFDAFIYLLSNTRDIAGLRQLLPILGEALDKGEIGGNIVASIVDRIRIEGGVPQIFGTQAVIRNGVVYIHPLLNDRKVDEYRKEYGLPPLRDQIIQLESRYLRPVVRSPRLWVRPELRKAAPNQPTANLPGIDEKDDAPLKVDTRLVNLNVRVLTKDLKPPIGDALTKDDFQVFENDSPQEIRFFNSTSRPFDLVLLLDYSGSTLPRRKLIADAAKSFIRVVRPDDKIAIVAFGSTVVTVSEFTTDRLLLRERIDKIDLNGDSPIWDSVGYVYKNILATRGPDRRSAIVLMTDAEDNSRTNTFADALEIVRNNDTTVFPVYVGRPGGFSKWEDRLLQKSRDSLWILAEESGGQLYAAKEMKDLDKVYEQIAGELGRIYSIGYEPADSELDGGWRQVRVELKSGKEMVVRTRRGYYAN